MKAFLIVFFCLLYNNLVFARPSKDKFKLELVQVLFRHGDRTPEIGEIYKTDPYYPDAYEQYGYGQLTKAGMQREHKFGEILRQHYHDFLGDYNVDHIYAYSTDFDRSKTSLQLVLNGLYPPTAKTRWSENIEWFPVPTHYEPYETDFITFDMFAKCSEEYTSLLEEAAMTPEMIKRIMKYQDLLEYVKDKTQIISADVFSIFMITFNIESVVSLGLPLPDWCSEEHYKKLQEIRTLFYNLTAHTELMRKIAVGPVIERLLENVKSSEKSENEKKLYLYSAHDLNVEIFNRAHNFTGIPPNPGYGSAVIMEKLRGPDDEIYLRMLYWTGSSEELITLKLENCDYECLLSNYEDAISPILPESGYIKCKTSANSSLIRNIKTLKPLYN